MTRGNIRRAQLVAPFGTGAMTVLADGTGVLAAGLDHWFERSSGDDSGIDEEEFTIREWRLEGALGVAGFRTPPDWRWRTFGSKEQSTNLGVPVPFLRFPAWHFCRYRNCRALSRVPLGSQEVPRCRHCAKTGKRGPVVYQVPFVAVCDYGHLQDFPFTEWVHRSSRPTCQGTLILKSTGAASLAAQVVECRGCGKSRTMSRITEGSPRTESRPATSYLSENLDEGVEFLCQGVAAWHGTLEGPGCGHPLRGSLRAAANVYYALVRSAIFLPRKSDIDPTLAEILSGAPLGPVIAMLKSSGAPCSPAMLRGHPSGARLLTPYPDDQVEEALAALSAERSEDAATSFIEEWDEAAFRQPEYHALTVEWDKPELRVQRPVGTYGGVAGSHLDELRLVSRLRETRALYGFNRVYPDTDFGLSDRKAMLRQSGSASEWLPAYTVNGEGLFLRLKPDLLREWEQRADVVARAQRLAALYARAQQQRSLRDREITPRFVLLHTFSHLVMNQLTFDCGYSSASLRERLFVTSDIAGVLIYTAAGDSEGTMGGLVRMGRPGFFEAVVEEALSKSGWCSADPICMESGDAGGQGPDSCNLAACHSCALVPETACEEFNRFLDRGLVSGTHRDTSLGFFPSVPTLTGAAS